MTPEDKEKLNEEGYIWDIENESTSSECARRCGYRYTVVADDTIYMIGERFKISWRELAEINGIQSPYTIYPGQVITIPIVIHHVRRGESLWSIAHAYNIPWQSLADANRIRYPYSVSPGQCIAIPGKRCEPVPPIPTHPPVPPVPPPRPRRIPCGLLYIVRAGDTVSSLASFFNVRNEDIIQANGLLPPFVIFVDQELLIPVTPRLYRVVVGDTLAALARRFGTTVEVIARVNALRPPYAIYEGLYLLIISPCRMWQERDAYHDYMENEFTY